MTDLLLEPNNVEDEALDAYSAIVTSVAERVVPSVAALRVGGRVTDVAVALRLVTFFALDALKVVGLSRAYLFLDFERRVFLADRSPTFLAYASQVSIAKVAGHLDPSIQS